MTTCTSTRAGERLRLTILASLAALIAIVWLWQLLPGAAAGRIALAALLSIPLWLPVRGLLRRDRRTYAWATLCVVPYFVLGTTEVIADPQARIWAALCLLLAFALFVMLVAYLRITRHSASSPPSQTAP